MITTCMAENFVEYSTVGCSIRDGHKRGPINRFAACRGRVKLLRGYLLQELTMSSKILY